MVTFELYLCQQFESLESHFVGRRKRFSVPTNGALTPSDKLKKKRKICTTTIFRKNTSRYRETKTDIWSRCCPQIKHFKDFAFASTRFEPRFLLCQSAKSNLVHRFGKIYDTMLFFSGGSYRFFLTLVCGFTDSRTVLYHPNGNLFAYMQYSQPCMIFLVCPVHLALRCFSHRRTRHRLRQEHEERMTQAKNQSEPPSEEEIQVHLCLCSVSDAAYSNLVACYNTSMFHSVMRSRFFLIPTHDPPTSRSLRFS